LTKVAAQIIEELVLSLEAIGDVIEDLKIIIQCGLRNSMCCGTAR
jgi:hypothetical protein